MATEKRAARVGRFELRRMLGQGAQAQVWLGYDARLEREVAIKLMTAVDASDSTSLNDWLREARNVSRLTHPSIVPVYEADVQGQQAYLVFEYVQGPTLAQTLSQKGALPALQAVGWMRQVLGALVVAHASGVVHRDLKPSNVLIDAHGQARVMDFGIAVRLDLSQPQAEGDAPIAGSPAYMAPEAIRGESVSPQVDVYAAGLMLAELLWGQPMRSAQGGFEQALWRAAHEPLAWPDGFLGGLDDALRGIIVRATDFDPLKRWASAALMAQALDEWTAAHQATAPALTEAAGGAAGNASGTLEFLLRRMRAKKDFPALSESIVRIQSMATSETESVSSITNEILKDVALTNKLLRMVNSAHYARSQPIGTVSRAVTLVGFNGIRNMALSLVLLEHMQDKGNAQLLKEEFLRALLAGQMATEFSTSTQEGEEAFIGALFQNLGRMLAQYYFPEEAHSVRHLLAAPGNTVSEQAAAQQFLGLSYEELGLGVARVWGLPEGIQRCISKPSGEPPSYAIKDPAQRMRWNTVAANDMADAVLHTPPEQVESALAQAAKRYARGLGLNADQLQAASAHARKKLVDMAHGMDIHVAPQARAARLLTTHLAAPPDPDAGAQGLDSTQQALQATELQATQVMGERARTAHGREQVAQNLAAGIQDITNAMVEDFRLPDILRMILEAMFRALDFHRILFAMRDARTDSLTGRFGLGDGIEAVTRTFSVPLSPRGTPDLFATIVAKGADTLISDTSDPKLADRLPGWYRQAFAAPTFLILPLQLKGRSFGLIYADKRESGGLQISEKELSLLRTLRNQAVMAFRQSSPG